MRSFWDTGHIGGLIYRWLEARNRVCDLNDHAKSEHYNDKIIQCGGDQRTIFKVVDSVLHRRSVVFPTCVSNQEMAQNLLEFFRDKLAQIRNGLESVSHDNPQFSVTDTDKIIDFVFDRFQPVTEEQMRKVVVKLSSATCVLDPIPTQMLKKCISSLSPVLTKITNISLSNGVFPTSLKVARVKPLIKKSNLDPEQLKNYRPVSNLARCQRSLKNW